MVARQVEYRSGELDIIAAKGGILCFVEVKTRASARFGAIESVDGRKQFRMRRAAELFCRECGLQDPSAQFDCIIVFGKPGDGTVTVRHYKNCF